MRFVLTEKPNSLNAILRKHEGHDLEICVFPPNIGGCAQLIDYDEQSVILDGSEQDLYNGLNAVSLDRILRKSACRCTIKNGELRRQISGEKIIRGQEKYEVIAKGVKDETDDAEVLAEFEEEKVPVGSRRTAG